MSAPAIEAAVQRLLFVADAAVADVAEPPPGVRVVIDSAAEVYVRGHVSTIPHP